MVMAVRAVNMLPWLFKVRLWELLSILMIQRSGRRASQHVMVMKVMGYFMQTGAWAMRTTIATVSGMIAGPSTSSRWIFVDMGGIRFRSKTITQSWLPKVKFSLHFLRNICSVVIITVVVHLGI